MNQHQNIFNMIDEMSSILLTLQTDMIKVMNEINQYKANNNMMSNMNYNMMNNMMNNMLNNMKNINIGMNNIIGVQGMKMQMPMNSMMNNINQNFKDDDNGWNLFFENNNDKRVFNIKISEQKLVKEAINTYKLKSGMIGS